jgi:hypothetical protein
VILPRDESPAAAALVKALNEIGLNATAVPGMVKLAFLAAAIPIFLFVRSIFFRRTTRINEGLSEFKKQANLAVSIFLFLIVCVVVFAAGKLAWTWWSSL